MFVTYPHMHALHRPAGLLLPQASGINEGEGARGASDPHALAPGEGQAV